MIISTQRPFSFLIVCMRCYDRAGCGQWRGPMAWPNGVAQWGSRDPYLPITALPAIWRPLPHAHLPPRQGDVILHFPSISLAFLPSFFHLDFLSFHQRAIESGQHVYASQMDSIQGRKVGSPWPPWSPWRPNLPATRLTPAKADEPIQEIDS